MPDLPRYPSYTEHSGFYNVHPEEHEEANPPPGRYYCTIDCPPPLRWEEFDKVRAKTNSCLALAGRACAISEDDLQDGGAWEVVDDAQDRTLTLDLNDLRLLSPAVVLTLQQRVLGEHNLWRILIHGEGPESVTLIYPSVVRIGHGDRSESLADSLARVVSEIARVRELRVGPGRRQAAYVIALIEQAAAHQPRPPVQVVAAFDLGFQGNPNQLSIWLLHDAQNPFAYEVVEPPRDAAELLGPSDRLIVRPDRSCERTTGRDLLEGENWVVAWHVPKGTEHVSIEGPRVPGIKRKRFLVEIAPSAVIKDTDLKEAEEAGKLPSPATPWLAAREVFDGPMERQQRHLRAMTPTLIKQATQAPLRLVGVFDCGIRDHQLTLWFVHSADQPTAYHMSDPGPRPWIGLGPSNSLLVGADGSCTETTKETLSKGLGVGELWLQAWHVPEATERVVLEGPQLAGKTREKFSFRIDARCIIKDEDLKR
jgi:hypothetical protein